MLMDIELQTEGGGHVAVVEIPPFQRLPAVVIWGVRTFTLHTAGERPADGALPVYREAFAFVSLTPSPGKPRPTPPPPPEVDRSAREVVGAAVAPGVPDTAAGPDGQQRGYVVLSAEERAKGFVRPVRRHYRHLKCGDQTTMGYALAETYARDPGFYGATFCVTCKAHFPVGPDGEFVWAGGFVITKDAERLVQNPGEEKVGT